MKNWYYAQHGEQKGPIDQAAIQNLYQNGQINPQDLVWQEGMPDWVKAETVLSLGTTSSPLASPANLTSTPTQNSTDPLPDYGDILCWGIAGVIIPCLGLVVIIALMVLLILELIAVRKAVEEGRLSKSSYSEIHPALMGLGIFCCSIIFYPLFMHMRNQTKLFKPQPHAVWFSIVILVISVIIGLITQFASYASNLSL
jgi:hypothetical protein